MKKYNQICPSCHNHFTDRHYPKGYCQKCYDYFRNGGKTYPLPPKGVVQKNEDNKIICHICGKAYYVLGGHVRGTHHMTIKEYKEQFGLCNKTHLTEINYHNKMRNYALYYNMDKQLITTGVNTRITKENNLRLGKTDREQTLIAKRNRKKT